MPVNPPRKDTTKDRVIKRAYATTARYEQLLILLVGLTLGFIAGRL